MKEVPDCHHWKDHQKLGQWACHEQNHSCCIDIEEKKRESERGMFDEWYPFGILSYARVSYGSAVNWKSTSQIKVVCGCLLYDIYPHTQQGRDSVEDSSLQVLCTVAAIGGFLNLLVLESQHLKYFYLQQQQQQLAFGIQHLVLCCMSYTTE